MATNFPTSLDSLTNPTSSDSLNSPSHSVQHSNSNDAIEALQAKVGADSSAVATSHDYKIAQLEAAATGKILQVVTATYSTVETTTSATYVDTSLTASITPSSATSKVLAIASVNQVTSRNSATSTGSAHLAIERGGSQLITSKLRYFDSDTVNRALGAQQTLVYVDSPATTSATTYPVQHKNGDSGTTSSFFEDQVGTLTLMEVSA